MVTGASRAEAALMVIDASHGVEENTRRHGYYLTMLGIRQIAVLVNKMDLIGYDQNKYETICQEYTAFLKEIGIVPKTVYPGFPPGWVTILPPLPPKCPGTRA